MKRTDLHSEFMGLADSLDDSVTPLLVITKLSELIVQLAEQPLEFTDEDDFMMCVCGNSMRSIACNSAGHLRGPQPAVRIDEVATPASWARPPVPGTPKEMQEHAAAVRAVVIEDGPLAYSIQNTGVTKLLDRMDAMSREMQRLRAGR